MTEKKKNKSGTLLAFHNTASHLRKKHASLSFSNLTFHSTHARVLHDEDHKDGQYTSPRHSNYITANISRIKMLIYSYP